MTNTCQVHTGTDPFVLQKYTASTRRNRPFCVPEVHSGTVIPFEYFIIGANGIDGTTASPSAAAYYTPNGQRRQQPQKGINIVQYDDGTVRKVMRK